MAVKDKTTPTPGTDVPEKIQESITVQVEQSETFQAQIERLEKLLSSFEKTLDFFAKSKGIQPVAQKTPKVYEPKVKKSKKR